MKATSLITRGPITRATSDSPIASCACKPIARRAVDAPQRDHVAEIVLPMAEEIAVPEIVREAAEPLVETFGRHMGRERLDFDAFLHRQIRAAARSAAAAAARRPAGPRRIAPARGRARSAPGTLRSP